MLLIASELAQLWYFLRKKKNYWIGFLGLLILAYIAAVTSPLHNADYASYMNNYNVIAHLPSSSFHFEKGYTYFGIFFFRLGLSYPQFRFVFSMLCVFIMYIGVRRFTNNVALFSCIYGATVFIIDSVQMRNFMMISIVILGLSFLINLSFRNVLFSIVTILISGQFHSLGYLFLIAVFLRLISFDFLLDKMWWFMGISAFIILLINVVGVSTITRVLATIIGMVSNRSNIVEKISSQYNYGTVPIRYVAVAISALCSFALLGLIVKVLMLNADDRLNNKLKVLYCGALLSIITLPTLSLAVDYSRIPRASFFFVIIGIALYYERPEQLKITKMRSLITFFVIIVCAMTAFAHFFTWGTAYRSNFLYLVGIFR